MILQTCPAGIKVQNLIRLSFIILNNYELVFLIIEAYSNDKVTAFKYFLRPKEVKRKASPAEMLFVLLLIEFYAFLII